MKLLERLDLEIKSGIVFVDETDDKIITDICKSLNNFNYGHQLSIVNVIKRLIQGIPLSVISLDKDSFIPFPGNKHYKQHKRTQDILMDAETNEIFNACAFGCTIRRCYDDDLGIEIENNYPNADALYTIELSMDSLETTKLYFSKGGIVQGDYIDKCYIRGKTKYSIPNPIIIPMSVIQKESSLLPYYIVDIREPKLKQLMESYDCVVKHDDNTYFNIRSYKKL